MLKRYNYINNSSDGTILALGTPTDTGVHNKGGYTLNYSEYIVYDTSQVCIRSVLVV